MERTFAERAHQHGLVHVSVDRLDIERRRRGKGFTYVDADGHAITDEAERARIEALAIPPAWRDVRIAADPCAHIQAVGRDEEGRLQYIYHAGCEAIRNQVKAERLLRFGRALPRIRKRLDADLKRHKPDLAFTAAVAGRLVDRAHLRAGHGQRPLEDGGRGATTLLKRDVRLNGTEVSLDFTGKSGKKIHMSLRDPVLLRRMSKLKKIGKRRIFAYRDAKGRRRYLSARDLNAYLKDAAKAPVTAKDFRTFAASARALARLATTEPPASPTGQRRVLAGVMREASELLANTPAVARSSYVHPLVVSAFEAGELSPRLLKGKRREGLTAEETALMRFLEERVGVAARGEDDDEDASEAAGAGFTRHPDRQPAR